MSEERPILIDEPLTVWESMDDWFCILCAHRLGQIGGASVEGTAAEMRDLARAILARVAYRGANYRCAVDATGPRVELWSPRNSITRTSVPLAIADDLAREILAAVPPPPGDVESGGER